MSFSFEGWKKLEYETDSACACFLRFPQRIVLVERKPNLKRENYANITSIYFKTFGD